MVFSSLFFVFILYPQSEFPSISFSYYLLSVWIVCLFISSFDPSVLLFHCFLYGLLPFSLCLRTLPSIIFYLSLSFVSLSLSVIHFTYLSLRTSPSIFLFAYYMDCLPSLLSFRTLPSIYFFLSLPFFLSLYLLYILRTPSFLSPFSLCHFQSFQPSCLSLTLPSP